MLERVLEIGKGPNLVEELRGLQAGQLGAHLMLRCVGNGEQQWQGYVLADDGSSLDQAFGLRTQAINARGQDGLHGGGDLQLLDGPREPVFARLAHERPRLDKRPHTLL